MAACHTGFGPARLNDPFHGAVGRRQTLLLPQPDDHPPDIIATNLNTRRAIQELVEPDFAEMKKEIAKLRAQLDRIEALLASERAPR